MTSVDRLASALSTRYRLEHELGAGGMATVYLAHDLKHERDVAIKVLHADLAAALGAERFLAEIKTTARLQHPHILPLLDSGSADGLLYYVMPYVAGESLRDRLNREKQLPIEDAVRIAREVADALGHAHAHGIIHRDIKPENILLQEGHALVADFGIALAVQSAGGQRMTQTGLSLGTPQYMSPEQAMGERAVDARADIYALGAVTYEMLTGEPPFTGATVQAIVAKVMASEPEPLTRVRRTVPVHVEAAVLRALAKLPADRWGSAGEYAAKLHDTSSVTSSRSIGLRRPSTGKRWVAMSTTIVLCVAGGWLAGGLRESTSERTMAAFSVLLPDSVTLALESHEGIALLPDGSGVLFIGRHNGQTRVYLRRFDTFDARVVAGTDGAERLRVAPDGRSIAVTFARPQAEVRRISLDDGSSTLLVSGSEGPAAWSAPDRLIAEIRDGQALQLIPAAGGAPRVLPVPLGVIVSTPWEVPTTGWALAALHFPSAPGSTNAIGLISLDSVPRVLVLTKRGALPRDSVATEELILGYRPWFHPSGQLLYSTYDGVLMRARFDPQDRVLLQEPEPALNGFSSGSYASLPDAALATNGTLAYVRGVPESLGRFAWIGADGSVDYLPLDPGLYRTFSLSPDGNQILVQYEHPNRSSELRVYDIRRPGQFQPVPDPGPRFHAAWWPDGKKIVYMGQSGYIVRRATANMAPLDSMPGDGNGIVDVSIDGHTVGFNGWGNASTPGSRFLDWRSGAMQPVDTSRSAGFGRFSKDGRWFTYAKTEGAGGQYAVRVIATGDPSASERVAFGGSPVFSRDGNTIYFSYPARGVSAIHRTARGWSAPTSVLPQGTVIDGGNHIDVGPDGRLLVVMAGKSPPTREIRVVTNWLPLRGSR